MTLKDSAVMHYIGTMRLCAVLAFALTFAAVPAAAQDEKSPDAKSDFREGFNLLEEGTKLLLRGLMNEMEPALRELQGALQELDAYHPPEVLPNGDIIIRRKTPLAPGSDPEVGPDGEVEL